jgi:hypothetical protein
VKPPKIPNQSNRRRRDSTKLPRGEAFSYYSARNNRPSDEPSKTRQSGTNIEAESTPKSNIHWWEHLPTIILTAVILFCLGYELILSTNPKVVVMRGSTSTYLLKPLNVYENAASKLLNKSFSNQNKLTINTGDIAAKLKTKFPELGSITITLPVLGHQPDIYISPATPELILGTQGFGSYLIGSTGTTLVNINNVKLPATIQLYTVTDESGVRVRAGEEILSISDINFIQFVTSQMLANKMNIKNMLLPGQSRELDVYFTTEPYFVKFNLDAYNSLKEQVGAFLTTKQYLTTSNSPTPVQYIDVRVPGRVYYK